MENPSAQPPDVGTPSATDYQSLGLKGLWALVGNSTAMAIIAVAMFIGLFQVASMHREGMSVLERLHTQERTTNKQSIEYMGKVIERNSLAIDTLAQEIKIMRTERLGKN